MLKVLGLIDSGFVGGGQTNVISISRNLDKKIIEFIIAANPEGGFKDLVKKFSLPFRDIFLPKIFKSKALKELQTLIKKEDIGFIHSFGGVAGVYSRMAKKKNPKLKVVHTIHGIHYLQKNIFVRLISMWTEQYLVKYSDIIIITSDTDYKKALKLKIIDPPKTVLIKNGIDLKKFHVEPDENLKLKLGIKKDDFVIGNVSRFDFQKNQRYLIKVFAKLAKGKPDLKLLLVGNGAHKAECEKQVEELNIKDKVIFTGAVGDPQNYYPLIDIYVFPTLWEGFSIMLIETLAAKRCLVVSALEENKELVKDNYNGFTFDLNDEISLIEKIEMLMNDPELRRRFSENAFKESEKYSEESMAKKFQDLYLKVSSK